MITEALFTIAQIWKQLQCSSIDEWIKMFIYIYIYMKEMATHSSTLAWTIPWMEEPGRLQSMGSQRVGQD